MRQNDAFTWNMESDPELRSTVVAVAWLDSLPSWDDLVQRLERATRQIPSFRQRPVEVPGRLATPRWTTDPHFDVAWHLRRVGVPAPHGRDEVLGLAALAAMIGFDRTRPLWEFTLVDGIEGGESALIMKMHHSLTDGIGGVQLALALFDPEADHAVGGPLPTAPPGEQMAGRRLVAQALGDRAVRMRDGFVQAVQHAPGAAARVVCHPLGTGADAVETARSIGRTVRPLQTVLSPVMTGRGPSRVLHTITVGLDELKEAGRGAGGTLNDSFMAGVTGGLRRYHEHHGAIVDELTVTLPISIRKADDAPGGNRITLQRLRVPLALADPVGRMRAIGASCRAARAERSLAFTDAIAGALNFVPNAVIGNMLKHVDFVASDVTGFPYPIFLCGAPGVGLLRLRSHHRRRAQRHALLLCRGVLYRLYGRYGSGARPRVAHGMPVRRLRRSHRYDPAREGARPVLSAALDVFRMRQYFNAVTVVRAWADGIRDDVGLLTDARRATFALPGERPRLTEVRPFPEPEPFEADGLRGKRLALMATGGSGALASVVGAARALEEAGVRPAVISLCSGSALFGFPIAAGIPAAEVAEFVLAFEPGDYVDLDWRRLSLLVPTAGRGFAGLIKGERIESTFRRLLGHMTLSELPIPAYAPVWSVEQNRLEYIGPRTHPDLSVARAIRMAIALPLFVAPVPLDANFWCDGGLVDIFPVRPVLDMEDPCDIALAINGFYPPEFAGEDATGWEDRRASILAVASQVRTCQQTELARINLRRLRKATEVRMIEPVPYEKVRGVGFYRQFLNTREWPAFMRSGRAETRRVLGALGGPAARSDSGVGAGAGADARRHAAHRVPKTFANSKGTGASNWA